MTETRPHEASDACWCQPEHLAYGDRLHFNAAGDLVAKDPEHILETLKADPRIDALIKERARERLAEMRAADTLEDAD